MKNHLIRMLFLLFAITGLANAQKTVCSRVTNFGKAQICLPKIAGYKECYNDSIVKILADATEVSSNSVLGYYLNDATYDQLQSYLGKGFNDFFKVYGTKEIQDYVADKSALLELKAVMDGNFILENWDLLKKELDKKGLPAKVGVPVFIKSYQLNESSISYMALTEYSFDDGTSTKMALTINGLLLNRRIVWMAYYVKYEGEESIERLQQRSNAIVEALLKANN